MAIDNDVSVSTFVTSVNQSGITPQAVGTGGLNPAGVMVNPVVSLGVVNNPPQSANLAPLVAVDEHDFQAAAAPVNFPANTSTGPNAINVDGALGSAPANGPPINSPSNVSFFK